MVRFSFLVTLVPLQERNSEGRRDEKWFCCGVVEARGELWNIPKACSTSIALQNSSSAGDTGALRENAAETSEPFSLLITAFSVSASRRNHNKLKKNLAKGSSIHLENWMK